MNLWYNSNFIDNKPPKNSWSSRNFKSHKIGIPFKSNSIEWSTAFLLWKKCSFWKTVWTQVYTCINVRADCLFLFFLLDVVLHVGRLLIRTTFRMIRCLLKMQQDRYTGVRYFIFVQRFEHLIAILVEMNYNVGNSLLFLFFLQWIVALEHKAMVSIQNMHFLYQTFFLLLIWEIHKHEEIHSNLYFIPKHNMPI